MGPSRGYGQALLAARFIANGSSRKSLQKGAWPRQPSPCAVDLTAPDRTAACAIRHAAALAWAPSFATVAEPGEVVQARHDVGYRAVRPADFPWWAMALLAVGDRNTDLADNG